MIFLSDDIDVFFQGKENKFSISDVIIDDFIMVLKSEKIPEQELYNLLKNHDKIMWLSKNLFYHRKERDKYYIISIKELKLVKNDSCPIHIEFEFGSYRSLKNDEVIRIKRKIKLEKINKIKIID